MYPRPEAADGADTGGCPLRLGTMKPSDIRGLVHFSDDGPHHETLFESEHLWSEVLCIQGTQGVGPLADATSDAVLAVLSGEISAQVGKGRARMKQWDAVLVPAASELTLRNASPEPAVILLVAAPPPNPSTAG